MKILWDALWKIIHYYYLKPHSLGMVCYSATSDWHNKFDHLCCSYNLSSLLSTQAYLGADKNTFFSFSVRYLGELAFLLLSQSSAFLFISHPFSQEHPLSLPWMVYLTDTSQIPLPLYVLQLGSPWISVSTGIWARITIALVDLIYGKLFSLWTRIFFPLPVLLSFPLSPYVGCWWDSTPLPGT